MRYFRPKSAAWWGGALLILLGVLSLALPDSYALTELGQAVTMLTGGTDASPGTMIALGIGIIGIRDKQERG